MINKKKHSLIAVIIFAIGLIGSLFTYRFITKEPISIEKNITENISHVKINTDNSRVYIYPTSDANIKVALKGKASSNIKPSLNTNVSDSTLNVTYSNKQRSIINFNFVDLKDQLKLTVYLPEKQYDSLNVESDNGYVLVNQLKASKLNITTDNGRVELKAINSNDLIAESNNGSIALKDLIAKNIRVKTANGRIHLDQVEGNLIGKTNNGRISLITKNLDRDINFSSENGKISIQTENEPTNVQFNVSVDNGRVDILNKYKGNSIIGNGKNHINLTTNNGSISVTK